MTDDRIWAVVVQQAMQQRRTTPTRSEMTTTEAGKRLLAFLDDPENAQSPLEPQWVTAIEAEVANDVVAAWEVICDKKDAEIARLRAALWASRDAFDTTVLDPAVGSLGEGTQNQIANALRVARAALETDR